MIPADAAEVRDLAPLGLGPWEARAYVALLREGPRSAREVADAIGLNRSRAYEVLDALETLGLAEVVLGDPKRYAPLPLAPMVDRALDEAERAAHAAEERWRRLPELFPPASGRLAAATGELRVVRDRREASAALARLLLDARREVAWLTSPEGVLRLANHAEGADAVERLTNGGVPARVVLVPQVGARPGALADARALLPPDVRVVAPAPGLAARAVADAARVATLYASPDDERAYRGADVLLETTVPMLVADALDLFERLWAGR